MGTTDANRTSVGVRSYYSGIKRESIKKDWLSKVNRPPRNQLTFPLKRLFYSSNIRLTRVIGKSYMTILYHYCSNNAFYSIIENRTIRLSSLSLSNDSMEGKFVAEILLRIAEADGLDHVTMNLLRESVSRIENLIDGLGFCLSEKGDLLSQWRGYANDATGVSIGFSKDYLERIAVASLGQNKSGFTLNRVEYDLAVQECIIKPTYIEIKNLIAAGAYKFTGRRSLLDSRTDDEIDRMNKDFDLAFRTLSTKLFIDLFSKLFLLKTKAFCEEQEWRLISYWGKSVTDICSFRVLNDRIIPFREFELHEPESGSIVEVILGPKNTTPAHVIESLLKQSGFPNAIISLSKASYR